MFADLVRQELHPNYTPILIRLRDLRVLENNLTDTLQNYYPLQTCDFVQSDQGWLTDKNTRFLFLLDGFDELLLEDRASGGLKEFLEQVEQFQKVSHHRFLVTGRPLALQGIERLLSQTKSLKRVELQPMDDSIRQIWLDKWAAKVGTKEATDFQQFLQSCPPDVKDKLAREPLLLYLLARMHREKRLNVEMFAQAEGIKAKIRIYDESIKWVLEKQRQDENLRLAGLESEDLRQFLTEAALCVVQSGNESAKVVMLEARLKDDNNPVVKLLQRARQEIPVENLKQEKVLNNLLTAFYIKPASGDQGGSVEFVHKSFGEFLFAERLMESFWDWTNKVKRRQREEDDVSDEVMDKQIYDLLGYGNLTPEIVEYLMGLLAQKAENSEFVPERLVRLFQRLEHFYLRWCDGEFIDAPPEKENLPQFKKEQLKKQLPDRETHLGLRQVDVYTGLNVMILLLELHRYAQTKDDLKEKIIFRPCGQFDTEGFDQERLLRIIGYSWCLGVDAFNEILRLFLRGAELAGTDLKGADLSDADLRGADLGGTDLRGADLFNTDLRYANLTGAVLNGADLRYAELEGADLEYAELEALRCDSDTKWIYARGLHKAHSVPLELAQQPTFSAAVLVSQGISWEKEGKVEEAFNAYNQALSLDASLEKSAQFCNSFCWFGSLHGYAADVLYLCENAVTLEPDNKGYYQDSRGLARALTDDLSGALEDFQAAVNSNALDYSQDVKQRRQRWIEALKAGQNPFTPEELEALRQAEG
jgi:hypothetical protein